MNTADYYSLTTLSLIKQCPYALILGDCLVYIKAKQEARLMAFCQASVWRQQMAVLLSGNKECEGSLSEAIVLTPSM